MKELKIQLDDWKKVEERLLQEGAALEEPLRESEDIYFHQAPGHVLKIKKSEGDSVVIRLEKQGDQFVITKREKLQDLEPSLEAFTKEYGVKCRLNKRTKKYQWQSHMWQFNLIEGVGDFLILLGDDPQVKLFYQLGIHHPQVVKDSFADWAITKKKLSEIERWNPIKQNVQIQDYPRFKEREIFLARMGENIGVEQSGKGKVFVRPVLVLKKFSHQCFWGVPLSKTKKQTKYHFRFSFVQNIESAAIISQLKLLDAKRLGRKIGMMEKQDFEKLRKTIKQII